MHLTFPEALGFQEQEVVLRPLGGCIWAAVVCVCVCVCVYVYGGHIEGDVLLGLGGRRDAMDLGSGGPGLQVEVKSCQISQGLYKTPCAPWTASLG